MCFVFFFFFKQKTAYEMSVSDWSSDVCSSDLMGVLDRRLVRQLRGRADERMIDVRRIRVRFIEGEDEQGLLAVHRGEELRHPAVDVVVSRRNRAGVHVVT